jgi:hypothetical protein
MWFAVSVAVTDLYLLETGKASDVYNICAVVECNFSLLFCSKIR